MIHFNQNLTFLKGSSAAKNVVSFALNLVTSLAYGTHVDGRPQNLTLKDGPLDILGGGGGDNFCRAGNIFCPFWRCMNFFCLLHIVFSGTFVVHDFFLFVEGSARIFFEIVHPPPSNI